MPCGHIRITRCQIVRGRHGPLGPRDLPPLQRDVQKVLVVCYSTTFWDITLERGEVTWHQWLMTTSHNLQPLELLIQARIGQGLATTIRDPHEPTGSCQTHKTEGVAVRLKGRAARRADKAPGFLKTLHSRALGTLEEHELRQEKWRRESAGLRCGSKWKGPRPVLNATSPGNGVLSDRQNTVHSPARKHATKE